MTDLTPRIEIAKEEHNHSCHSCGARNYQAYTKPVDVDTLFAVEIGTGHTTTIVFCADCLQLLAQAIHPHRSGS